MRLVRLFFGVGIFLVAISTNSCRKDELTGPFGISAHDFLSSEKYNKLTVEILFVNGYKPDDAAIVNLQSFLEARLNKPSGITVTYKNISSPGKSYYTVDDVQKIEREDRDHYTHGNSLYSFIFFADAPYSDPNVLGIAYGSTSTVIFEKTVVNNSGGFGQPTKTVLESTVTEHEFGHLMGLVDNGTNMVHPHLDSSHGQHCNNQNCLMYYATETTDILSNLIGGNIPPLDGNCIEDLQANGGK